MKTAIYHSNISEVSTNVAVPNTARSVQIRSYFWSVFSYIRTEYGALLRTSPYSVRIKEMRTRNNSIFGHFSCSVMFHRITDL